jgi:hypothetical protein
LTRLPISLFGAYDPNSDWETLYTDYWDRKPFDFIGTIENWQLAAFFRKDTDSVSTVGSYAYSHTAPSLQYHSQYGSVADNAASAYVSPSVVPYSSSTGQNLVRHDPRIAAADYNKFIHICKTSGKRRQLFASNFSVGFPGFGTRATDSITTKTTIIPGDQIFAIDGARTPFILRKTPGIQYKIVDQCYLWAALELDCWNPGTKKGRWGPGIERPTGKQTRMIEIC